MKPKKKRAFISKQLLNKYAVLLTQRGTSLTELNKAAIVQMFQSLERG
jgi:hypothetical protein